MGTLSLEIQIYRKYVVKILFQGQALTYVEFNSFKFVLDGAPKILHAIVRAKVTSTMTHDNCLSLLIGRNVNDPPSF